MGERARAVDRDAFLSVKIGLNRIEAAAFIGVTPTSFDSLVAAGEMPSARRFGDDIRWLRQELERAASAAPLAVAPKERSPYDNVGLRR